MALRTLSARAAAALDEELMSTGAFSLDQLMELAGLSVAQVLHHLHTSSSSSSTSTSSSTTSSSSSSDKTRPQPTVLVACGPGNNGGDGLVAARHLYHCGWQPTIYYPKRGKHPLYGNLVRQLEHLRVPFTSSFEAKLEENEYVLDAIFGFSFSGSVREPFPAVIRALAATKKTVLAVDAPSSWDIASGPSSEEGHPGQGYMPDALISLTAPKPLVKHFTGRHFVGGRFVGREVAARYGFDVPAYPGAEQWVEVPLQGREVVVTDDEGKEEKL